MTINRYLDEDLNRARLLTDGYRNIVGGMWDVIGPLQKDFLVSQGLLPHHGVLDVGCGSLRGGVRLTQYLDPDNYYGIDASKALMEAGYTNEIEANDLAYRLPREHLYVTDSFQIPFERKFEYALAVSLFTHLTLDYLEACLNSLAFSMETGGRFYATFFEGAAEAEVIERPLGVRTFSDHDPFHFPRAAIAAATPTDDWTFEWIGEWNHPRDQQMACFVRR